MGELSEGCIFDIRYKVSRKLGEGAWKKIYLAIDNNLNRRVVLSTLKENIDSSIKSQDYDKPLDLFLQEPKIISKIMSDNSNNHENLKYFLRVFDIGQDKDSGINYFSSEYSPAVSLETLLEKSGSKIFTPDELKSDKDKLRIVKKQNSNINIGEIIKILEQVALGLEVAAGSGIYHRDLNPGNVLVYLGANKETLVKLIDFSATASDSFTDNKSSLIFRSPEEFIDDSFTEKSAVWNFGVLQYRCLTTQYPFFSKIKDRDLRREDIKKQVLEGKIISPRKLNPKISPELSLVTKCCIRDKITRFESLSAIRDNLTYRRNLPRFARKIGLIGLVSIPLCLFVVDLAFKHRPLSECIVYNQDGTLYSMSVDGSKVKKIEGSRLRKFDKDVGFFTTSKDNGNIFFTPKNFFEWDVYSMRTNGSLVRNLTNTKNLYESNISYSNDGKIAYLAQKEGKQDYRLFVMDSDGKNKEEIDLEDIAKHESFSVRKDKVYFRDESTPLYEISPDGIFSAFQADTATFPGGGNVVFSDYSKDRAKRVLLVKDFLSPEEDKEYKERLINIHKEYKKHRDLKRFNEERIKLSDSFDFIDCIIFEDNNERIRNVIPVNGVSLVGYSPGSR